MNIFYFLFSLIVPIIAETECPIITTIDDRRKDKSSFRLVQQQKIIHLHY
jgi:hypothetical protein